jgi:hypothetical protein
LNEWNAYYELKVGAMAGQTITYGCTALVGTNKVGDLVKDKHGYYDMVLGALAAYNSAGAYYELNEAKALFESSSELMRRINGGNLRGEVGHPRYQEGMSERAWFNRVNDIVEPNCCCHFSEVQLSYDTLKDAQGRPLVAVMGKVRPSGANERFLERQLDNPKENVCYSVRSFTNDVPQGGIMVKYLRKIVTWDLVGEPGIGVANKYSVPSLESRENNEVFNFDLTSIVQFADAERSDGISMESGQSHGAQLLQMIGYVEKNPRIVVPASYRW